NIKMACSKRKGLRLLRCLREPGAGDSRPGVIHMPDVEAAVTWLSSVKGNILVTTGSKELATYTRIRDYGQRIYARILPSAEAVAQCRSLGFEGRHIIAMQGPFSEEMNLVQLREYGCAYLVTKDGGAAGGFSEKIKAAHRAGAAAVVIDRPGSGEGISLDDIKGQLKEWMDHEKKGSIYG
ncbi:MAG: precorrin-6A/cobalt-precorrin-6A reductase, partial [Enterocloster aldenensis]